MDNVFIRLIETQGFAIIFGVGVLWAFYKFAPKFLAVWADFIKATSENTIELRSMNREVVRSGEQSKSVLEELRVLKQRLDVHSADATEIKENQEKILELLNEMQHILEGRNYERKNI